MTDKHNYWQIAKGFLGTAIVGAALFSTCNSKAYSANNKNNPLEQKVESTSIEEVKDANEAGKDFYTVKNGDTLTKIANYYGLNWKDLATWNNLKEPYKIDIGQSIYLQRTGETKEKKKIVVLDPGHGKDNITKETYDPGAVASKIYEADVVLGQAKKIKSLLEKKGYEVYLTRQDNNTSTPKDSRAGIAEKLKADILVSLHCNGDENSSANGQETYYKNEGSKELARYIQSELVKEIGKRFKISDRGVKQKNYAVLRTEIPAVLVESGFLTNEKDKKYLTDDINDVENAIASGIDAYLKSKASK